MDNFTNEILEIQKSRKNLYDRGNITLVGNKMEARNPSNARAREEADEYNRLAEQHAKMM